ncbi:AMP-binding protein [Humibacillus sp. DSM 29435]|uniref:AMP-binding protein n=1 Tax=Humibacillus sp. DSM 29435 TaxID=1869167 RepID=UPI0008730E4C|nr:AMP-binding protein [Humibacillus sp. DSM 29435]OFE18657.1 AMP-binding protein [Humibacillus sp. DSM 29435]
MSTTPAHHQLSYASGPADLPLIGETIGQRLVAVALEFPDREALVDVPSGRRWTYRALDTDVDRLASGLLALGLETGDRVGIWAPNVPEWVIVQYATAKIGAILVNINPAYQAPEAAYVLEQAGIRLLIAAPSHRSSDYVSMIEQIRPEAAALRDVFVFGTPEWETLANTPADVAAVAERLATLDRDDAINIQYTSGTTGFPKGATLSHHNILNNGFLVTEVQRFTEVDRLCVQVPFYHCFGMVMGNLGSMAHGSCVVIPAPAFDAEATMVAIEQERCTAIYGVPTMYIAILEHPRFAEHDFSSLRTGIMSGSPCPAEVMRRVVDLMHLSQITISYGMTETSPVSTHTSIDASIERRVSTVGTVHPHVEIKLIDPVSGLTVPVGSPGELCARGYLVMKGYWEAPAKTAEAIDPNGWMHTGDLAVMDDEGYFRIVGRLKDLVIRGGENVYPVEVEEFLYSHPDIVDVQVIGVPDAKYGEELCAWIRMREGREPITAESLRAFCEGKLARYKVPRYVHLTDEFPMTVTGKIRKREMRERSPGLLGLG